MRYPDAPTGSWIRESGYPKFNRADGGLTVTDRFFVAVADFDHEDMQKFEALTFAGLNVRSVAAEPDVAASKVFATLVYSRPTGGGGPTAADGAEEYTLDDSGQELPIDMRYATGTLVFANYKTCHNYALAAKTGEDANPAFWSTATDTKLFGVGDYRWVKDSGELPAEDWFIAKEKTKRIESVFVPSPVVVVTTKFQNYNQAVAKRETVGKRVAPPRTFGITGEWLVVSSSIGQDGRRWVCTTRYQNAPKWDADYYA